MFKAVGCEVFKRELESIAPGLASGTLWLPAGLHVDIGKLGESLRLALSGSTQAACLYGACHPEIDGYVAETGGCRLPGKDCIDAFLGEGERKAFEGRKAFVMTPGWLRHWRDIFQTGLSWDNTDARQNFGFYDVIILLDFGIEQLDDMEILEFFEFTGTPVEVVPANLDHFRSILDRIMTGPLKPLEETGARP